MLLEEKIEQLESAPLDFLDVSFDYDKNRFNHKASTPVFDNFESLECRISILLILAKVKPATVIRPEDITQMGIVIKILEGLENPGDLLKLKNYDPARHCIECRFPNLINLLKELGLPYDIGKMRKSTYKISYRYKNGTRGYLPAIKLPEICVAQNLKWLQRIKKVCESYDEVELGRCLGYPETAVQAFSKRKYHSIRDLNRKGGAIYQQDPEFWLFSNMLSPFFVSEENWQEELKVVRLWYNAIKRLSPRLYVEIIHQYCGGKGL